MVLKRLDVRRVRNISEAQLELAAGLNMIVGPNGSGKTSLLEAAYLLGTGQSFRTANAQGVIAHGEDTLSVFGLLEEDGLARRVGVERGRNGSRDIVVDGRRNSGRAELARVLPVTAITPDSHRIVSGGPAERRAYLDWVLFHVERRFHGVWSTYQRALRQRNELLKSSGPARDMAPWEEMMVSAGEVLDSLRAAQLEALSRDVRAFIGQVVPEIGEVNLQHLSGWPRGRSLGDALQDNRAKDAALGYTSVGPHRSDIEMRTRGQNAAATLSRGQQKGLVVALKLAGVGAIIRGGVPVPLLLFDDLPSELDEKKRRLVMAAVAGFGCQTMVTATHAEDLEFEGWPTSAMFHVEQGNVHKLV